MAEEGDIERLRQGLDAWNLWRVGPGASRKLDLAGANLFGLDLGNSDGTRGANLCGLDLRMTTLWKANLRGAELIEADLSHSNLKEANLREANLQGTMLDGVDLTGADLTHARFFEAIVTSSTGTSLAKFGDEHDSSLDGGASVRFARRRDRLLDWGKLRAIGSFPLFGASYVSLALSLITINGIGWLNAVGVRPFSCALDDLAGQLEVACVSYPIPIPERAVGIMASSLLLAIGATLYRVLCPENVRHYSETEWLKALGHSVLVYRVDRIQRWWAQAMTLVFVATGGATALYLIAEQVWRAIGHVLRA